MDEVCRYVQPKDIWEKLHPLESAMTGPDSRFGRVRFWDLQSPIVT